MLITACEQSELEIASEKYKNDIDCESLKTLFEHIQEGMAKDKVISLLGEPVYSPTEGVHYYDSNCEPEFLPSSGGQRKATVGVVVEYRDEDYKPTDRVHNISMGPIGE